MTTNDALSTTLQTLSDRSPLETTVLYITSDAGEGKTSLINEVARAQAQLFVENKADWLLVPIPLGGRPFLRFDDITVGALQNRYRFPFLYYNSFLALVRMGVIIPAFDGFEEMFVESGSGEALSAMGILVNSLESQGTMVVAARKAYFEFENLRTQERLFDTIRTLSVGFSKLELQRWSKSQFLAYCKNRHIAEAEELYRRVSERLSPSHALLTRAVLVKRLVDVACESPTLDSLLDQLQRSGPDFFSVFVRGLVEREALEKWTERSADGNIVTPLLTVEEHCQLLSQIALSMWEARVDYIKRDALEFVADYFSETSRKGPQQAHQIRVRLRGHAMLVPSSNSSQAVEFDHDEFRLFFLGEGIARQIQPLGERTKAEILGIFRRGLLPRQAQHALIRAVTRHLTLDRLDVVRFLLDVSGMDSQASYSHENCSDIIIRMLNGLDGNGLEIANMSFGPDALRHRKLRGVVFTDCYFAPSSLDLTALHDCSFAHSRFAQLRMYDSTTIENVSFDECLVDGLSLVDKHRDSWDPNEVRNQLQRLGIVFKQPAVVARIAPVAVDIAVDNEVRDIEKLVRYFMRSTHISEGVMLMKLGMRGHEFIAQTLPLLEKNGIVQQIPNLGSGTQRRFRMGVPLQRINAAIAASRGSFQALLQRLE